MVLYPFVYLSNLFIFIMILTNSWLMVLSICMLTIFKK